jgi:mono/diheme cytochrome c family protein
MKPAFLSRGLAATLGASCTAGSTELPPPSARQVDFVADIQPIFRVSCYECHGPKKQEASFRLDHKGTALKGGEMGIAIKPGDSANSLLIHLVSGTKDEVMPKKGPRLSADQIGLLRAWIDQGAEWPENASVVLKEANRDHWAFKMPVRPALLSTKRTTMNTVDAFIGARLDKEGLKSSPPADPITLCRRIHLDLIGLPPSPAEVDAFAAAFNSDAKKAVADLTEKLLASPHYGERWGRPATPTRMATKRTSRASLISIATG